jgi:hypothetical protein
LSHSRSISDIYNYESFFEFVEICDVGLDIVVTDDRELLEDSSQASHASQLAHHMAEDAAPYIDIDSLYYQDIVDEFLGGASSWESSKVTHISEDEKEQSLTFKVMIKLKLFIMFAAKKFRLTRRYMKRALRDKMEVYCYRWHLQEQRHPPSYEDVPLPPCSLGEALANPAFVPDKSCSSGMPYCQFFQKGAYHCVRSVSASWEGAGQHACYDKAGNLLEFDEGGGTFDKAHISGYTDIDWSTFPPTINALKIWRLSHFVEDILPFLACCKFTNNCRKYSQVRPTQSYCDIYKDEYKFR